MTQPVEAPPTPPRRFVTVLRASAAIRLLRDECFSYNTEHENDTWELVFRTRYVKHGLDQLMPRELWVEVVGPGESLDDAMRRAQGHANVGLSVLSLAMNAGVEPMPVEYCFDVTSDLLKHDFHQTFLLDETGYPRFARPLRTEPTAALFGALSASPRADRLYRATAQYDMALRSFIPGSESIAVAHLWMAIETLTPVALARRLAAEGCDRAALCRGWGIRLKQLDGEVRRRILFSGDDELFSTSKEASDGLEHGYLDLAEVYAKAISVRNRLASAVRRSIFSLADAGTACDALLTTKFDTPMPASRVSKYLRCTLSGAPEHLALTGELYPYFRLKSAVASVSTTPDGSVTVHPTEQLTKKIGKDVEIDDLHFEIWGPPGADLTTLPPEKPATQPDVLAADVLASVADMIDGVTAGIEGGRSLLFPRDLAFQLFGQGVAYFQSVQALIDAELPLEALLPLRALVIVAGRLEEAANPEQQGILVRLAIDDLDKDFGDSADHDGIDQDLLSRVRARRGEWLALAESAVISVPDAADPIENASVWQSLTAEMALADRVAQASYGITGLKVIRSPGGAPIFSTRLARGPLVDMVASGCAMAALVLLSSICTVFDWDIDGDKAAGLLATATVINEEAAQKPWNSDEFPTNDS